MLRAFSSSVAALRNAARRSSSAFTRPWKQSNLATRYAIGSQNIVWKRTLVETSGPGDIAEQTEKLEKLKLDLGSLTSSSFKGRSASDAQNSSIESQMDVVFDILSVYKTSLYIKPRDTSSNALLHDSLTLLKSFLQSKHTSPILKAKFLLSTDVRGLTKLGLWQSSSLLENELYIDTVSTNSFHPAHKAVPMI